MNTKFPYKCVILKTKETFYPTLIDYDNEMVWHKLGQSSGNGIWYDFENVVLFSNPDFIDLTVKITDENTITTTTCTHPKYCPECLNNNELNELDNDKAQVNFGIFDFNTTRINIVGCPECKFVYKIWD